MSGGDFATDPVIERGEPARLIPSVSDTSREQRVVSSLLATMAAVPEFGRAVLAQTDAPQAQSYKITAFTEVVLRGKTSNHLRPDGLIRFQRGQSAWTALVEGKVGGSDLSSEQIEQYIELASELGLNAVVTISNQFTGLSSHPIAIDGRKLKTIRLHHLPWMHILAQAILLEKYKGLSDPDQAFILRELTRYLHHPSSGVLSFNSMPSDWRETCAQIQTFIPLSESSVTSTVTAWNQLCHHLALQLSVAIGRNVTVRYSRQELQNPDLRTRRNIAALCQEGILEVEFDIPEGASPLKCLVDLKRRNISVWMTLDAPKDRMARAAATWLVGQLSRCSDDSVLIRAIWPRKAPTTSATLAALRDDRLRLLNGGDQSPNQFEVCRVVDLGVKFRGSKTFVDGIEAVLHGYYTDVGEKLRVWTPPTPKVKLRNAGELLAAGDPVEGYTGSTLPGGGTAQNRDEAGGSAQPVSGIGTDGPEPPSLERDGKQPV